MCERAIAILNGAEIKDLGITHVDYSGCVGMEKDKELLEKENEKRREL